GGRGDRAVRRHAARDARRPRSPGRHGARRHPADLHGGGEDAVLVTGPHSDRNTSPRSRTSGSPAPSGCQASRSITRSGSPTPSPNRQTHTPPPPGPRPSTRARRTRRTAGAFSRGRWTTTSARAPPRPAPAPSPRPAPARPPPRRTARPPPPLLRVHDPVLGHAELAVPPGLFHEVDGRRRRREHLHDQPRRLLHAPIRDPVPRRLRHEQQVRPQELA